jgi:hypothetical protein
MEIKENYRSNLSREIQAGPDKIQHQELFPEAKNNDEYERDELKDKGVAFEALIQNQAPWGRFNEENINENHERKPATAEQIEVMDKRLRELGALFSDSDINWHLDGALNISLMNGEYIGNHKDVDLSVDEKDLEKLETQLLKNGYGLFLSQAEDDGKEKTMRRVGYKNFKESATDHPLIAAIDENGIIIDGKALNYVDAHIVERNPEGSPLGVSGAVMPEKWAKPYSIDFQEQKINISHPGKVLYFKLHQGRDYDVTDIKRLIETGKLSEEDINDVENVYENEFLANKELAYKIFKKVEKELNPNVDEEKIFEALMRQPKFNEKEEMRDSFKSLAKTIFELKDWSAEKMLNVAVRQFGLEERNNQKREELRNTLLRRIP